MCYPVFFAGRLATFSSLIFYINVTRNIIEDILLNLGVTANQSFLEPFRANSQHKYLTFKSISNKDTFISFGINDDKDEINTELNILKIRLKLIGVDPELCENLDPSQVHKWDNNLLSALNSLELPYGQTSNYTKLLNATVKGEYEKFLFDPTSEIGIHNNNIKNQFQMNGWNFDNWINFNKDNKKNFDFTVRRKTYELALWDRNPGKDFFIGNHVGSCISTTGDNSYIIYNGLIGIKNQYILIREKSSKKLEGYCRIVVNPTEKYFVRPFCKLKYPSKLAKSDDFKNSLKNFINEYCFAICGNYNILSPEIEC